MSTTALSPTRAQSSGVVSSDIPRRHIDFVFDAKKSPRYYYGNDPFLSAFWGGLSALFPAGERFFIDSVRHYRDQITDKKLLQDISGFIGQEALHTQAHERFDEMVTEMGYPVKKLEKFTTTLINLGTKPFTPMAKLAATVCLEHYTAIIAEQLLRDENHQKMADPELIKLWLWHALEENEHKSVAYDVYRAVGGSDALRIAVMVPTTLLFFLAIGIFQTAMLASDKQLFNVKNNVKGIKYFFGRQGLFTKLAPQYLDFFKPSFHPTDHDTVALLEEWREKLFGENGSMTSILKKVH